VSDSTEVYLVEDHDPQPAPYTKYFAKVYLSRAKGPRPVSSTLG